MGMVLRLANGTTTSAGEAGNGASIEPRHFVCVDEFGKGTEDDCASAICAAALLQLDQVRACSTAHAYSQLSRYSPRTALLSSAMVRKAENSAHCA